MPETRGAVLLVALALLVLAFPLGRAALRQEGPPAFFPERREGTPIALGNGFPVPGIHQISDGTRPLDVIKMTYQEIPAKLAADPLLQLPLRPGESLEIILDRSQPMGIKRKWIAAGQRIVLGIPLHPDRMEREDWPILPGIGPRLAAAIEEDRQKNGDFGSPAALTRVKGIGPSRLEAWRDFFPNR